ncbi:MAG: response regulator [Anaerolineales bacterium]|jgi:putative two-component system response regulator|nr:response regulator [Anaerolineales bacterium]
MARVLLTEDEDSLRLMTRTVLELDGHQVFAFANGQLALDAFLEIAPDVIVSDISMPVLDGFGLLDAIRRMDTGAIIPFLFLTARSEHEDLRLARTLGVDDYLLKPYNADELLEAVRVRVERRRAIELFESRQAHLQTITMLANLVEARDAYTADHVQRVQALALELGAALNWTPEAMVALEYGSLLHDIGKIAIPETILNKPGKLTPEELEIMHSHTRIGEKILRDIPHLHGAIPYVVFHHERWDGSGYPDGLKGEDIPREGRLMAIVDFFDALGSVRSYHQNMAVEDVLKLIQRNAGKHFDPIMAEVFVSLQQAKRK